MSNVQLIIGSVKTAKNSLGDLVINFTYRKKTGSVYSNGRNVPTYASDVSISGIFDKFEDREIDGILVKVTDTKLVLFNDGNSQVPNLGDVILWGATEYQVVRPYPVFAGPTAVLCIVQVRT